MSIDARSSDSIRHASQLLSTALSTFFDYYSPHEAGDEQLTQEQMRAIDAAIDALCRVQEVLR